MVVGRSYLGGAFLSSGAWVLAQSIALDDSTLKAITERGTGFAAAIFMFLWYRRDMKEKADQRIAELKADAEERERDLKVATAERDILISQWKGQSDALLHVVIENTAAMTSNTKIIEALHRREDQLADILARMGYEVGARKVGEERG